MKVKIISNHTKYKKDQVIDLKEKESTSLLTSGKAIRIHRKPIEALKEIIKQPKKIK